MNVRSAALPEGYDVSTEYEFKTSFSAIKACQNVVDAFQPTVSELLNKVVTHPQFSELAGAGGAMTMPAPMMDTDDIGS